MSPFIYKNIKEITSARKDRRTDGSERKEGREGEERRPENLSRTVRPASMRCHSLGTVFFASQQGT